MRWRGANWVLSTLSMITACGGEATGDARVLVSTEDTIVSGLEPGASEENIADGWTVTFDTYVVAIGAVSLARSDDSASSVASEEVSVIDLRAVGTGVELARFEGIEAGRWDRFSFETPAASAGTPCDATVEPADCDAMRSLGLTYLIRGTMTKPGGESCPPPDQVCRPAESIEFALAVPAPARFSSCESEGVGGIAVPEGGESTDSVWIHGDHIFFNGFGGAEGSVIRRAQWLANADVDADDFVDMQELETIGFEHFSILFDGDQYSFAGPPIAIENAADFVRAQLMTQGHLNGEGECVPAAL